MTLLWSLTTVLTLAVALNLLLTLGLVRRLRIHGAEEGTSFVFTQVGARVPAFDVETVDGGSMTDERLGPDPVLAFLSPGCDPCASLARRLRTTPDLLGLEYLVVVVGEGDQRVAAQELAASLPQPERVAVLPPTHLLPSLGDGVTAFPTLLGVHEGVVGEASHRPEDLRVTGSWTRA